MEDRQANQASSVLQANKERVLKLWEERARQELPPAQFKEGLALRDHLPILLSNIIAALSPEKRSPDRDEHKQVGIEHGADRVKSHDYTIGQTLAEYTILRKAIFEVLEVELTYPLTGIQREVILDCLSLAVAGSAEEFSRREKAQLRESNEELQRFASVASHDLQEPLRMVSSYIQLIERELSGQIQGELKEYFGFVTDGAKRMSILISSLLDYAKIGSDPDAADQTDLNVALKFATQNLATLIQETRVTISTTHLPTVRGSETAYVLLFQNLVGNAIKYRSKDEPQVSISASMKGDKCVISVMDNGIGIAAEHREKIFGLFNRLHSRAEYPGVGIGLGLCKRVVTFYGGKIWVTPNPTGGSIFRFSVPGCQEKVD